MPNKIPQSVGFRAQTLEQHRKYVLKKSQRELAEKGDFSNTWLSDIEHGREPTEKTVPTLAKLYGVSEDKFWKLFRKEGA